MTLMDETDYDRALEELREIEEEDEPEGQVECR